MLEMESLDGFLPITIIASCFSGRGNESVPVCLCVCLLFSTFFAEPFKRTYSCDGTVSLLINQVLTFDLNIIILPRILVALSGKLAGLLR